MALQQLSAALPDPYKCNLQPVWQNVANTLLPHLIAPYAWFVFETKHTLFSLFVQCVPLQHTCHIHET